MQLRIAGIALSFVIVFASGIWLTRAGKPYNGALLNVHKLVALAGVVLVALVIRQQGRAGRLGPVETGAVVVTALLLVGSIVTGGLASVDSPMPRGILTAHRIAPFLGAIATAVTLYILLRPA